MEDKMLRIGILGPRPYFIGGHDEKDLDRTKIKKIIDRILQDYLNQGFKLFGLTGLDLGVEQDFAQSCIDNNVLYQVILSHEKPQDKWANLTEDIVKKYNFLIRKSKKVITVNKGPYSPKKNQDKNSFISNESDIVIIVINSELKNKNQKDLEYLQKLAKQIIIVNI